MCVVFRYNYFLVRSTIWRWLCVLVWCTTCRYSSYTYTCTIVSCSLVFFSRLLTNVFRLCECPPPFLVAKYCKATKLHKKHYLRNYLHYPQPRGHVWVRSAATGCLSPTRKSIPFIHYFIMRDRPRQLLVG